MPKFLSSSSAKQTFPEFLCVVEHGRSWTSCPGWPSEGDICGQMAIQVLWHRLESSSYFRWPWILYHSLPSMVSLRRCISHYLFCVVKAFFVGKPQVYLFGAFCALSSCVFLIHLFFLCFKKDLLNNKYYWLSLRNVAGSVQRDLPVCGLIECLGIALFLLAYWKMEA